MKCLKYFYLIDSDGFPILGTMRGLPEDPCMCNLKQATGVATTTPAGQTICNHPTGRRFFYRTDSKGKILPNSLTTGFKWPSDSKCVIEIKKYC